jgi:hypothetical protein
VAKVEWHPGEVYPRVGFIVTSLARPAECVVAFYNQRGAAEQHSKEGKGAIRWTRLSCRTFAANAVRLQLHALAYNFGNFMPTWRYPRRTAVVADQSARETDQDRRQGRQPWALCDLPDGLGRRIATDVRRHCVADRPVAGTARIRMTRAGRLQQVHQRERYAYGQGNRTRFSVRVRQPEASIALGSRQRRTAIAQAGEKCDPRRETVSRMSVDTQGDFGNLEHLIRIGVCPAVIGLIGAQREHTVNAVRRLDAARAA